MIDILKYKIKIKDNSEWQKYKPSPKKTNHGKITKYWKASFQGELLEPVAKP